MTRPPLADLVAARRLSWRPGIEALRGVAALVVVFHHMWSLSTQPHFPGYEIVEGFGTLGVNLFFLLSGYLLVDSFWGKRDLVTYWVRRFFRIAPAYYLVVTVLFLFFANHDLLFSPFGVRQVLANGTFTHYMFPETASSLNVDGALWTLTAEFMLYLLLPLMALPFARWPRLTFLTLCAIGVGWKLWIALDGDWLRHLYFGENQFDLAIESLYLARQFVGLVPIFALGIGLRYLEVTGRLDAIHRRLPSRMSVLVVVAVLVPPALSLFFIERATQFRHWIWFTFFEYAMAVLLAAVVLTCANPAWKAESLPTRIATWLGERSYSLYILHFPIILSMYGRGPLERAPEMTHLVPRLVIILVLTVLGAHISYVLVERPGIAAGRSIVGRLKARRTTSGSQTPPRPLS